MAKTATKTAGKKRGPPLKQCRNCGEMVHARKSVCPKCGTAFEIKSKTQATAKAVEGNGRRTRAKKASNGAIDVRAVLTVQALLKTMNASELKRIVDDVANVQVPF